MNTFSSFLNSIAHPAQGLRLNPSPYSPLPPTTIAATS